MNFYFFFCWNSFFNKELKNVTSVISLKLNYGSPFWMFMRCTITVEYFLEKSENFSEIKIFRQTLYKSGAFSSCTLLIMDVDNVICILFLFTFVGLESRIIKTTKFISTTDKKLTVKIYILGIRVTFRRLWRLDLFCCAFGCFWHIKIIF